MQKQDEPEEQRNAKTQNRRLRIKNNQKNVRIKEERIMVVVVSQYAWYSSRSSALLTM